MWDNPYLTSKKVAQFYHQVNKKFSLNNPSDADIIEESLKDEGEAIRAKQMHNKQSEMERFNMRKAERNILQRSSCQSIKNQWDISEELASTSPELTTELKMKKSLSFKIPSIDDNPLRVKY